MANMMHAPAFDGRAGSFATFGEKETLWNEIPTMGPDRRAANLLLHMSDVAREVCVAVGKDVVGNMHGAEQISKITRERFAPDAIDNIFHDMVKFMYVKCYGPEYGHVPGGIRHFTTGSRGKHAHGKRFPR